MTNYPHLAQKLFNVPLAITPQKAEIVMAALADRFGLARLFHADGRVVALDDWDGDIGEPAEDRAYEVVQGVAIIPVTGTLVQKLGTLHPYSGMTGYDGLRACLSMALDDRKVKAIVLDIDSPGGEVAGCFDLADSIFKARGKKPVWAILTESAYSAAYALASACDYIVVPRTGGTGSVGVICMHVDMSKALGAAGVNVTLIHYGDRKADGADSKPLSDAALSRYQSDVDAMGELFVNTVARNRGMSAKAVRSTQATTFLGAAGVEIGFADAVMAPDEAFRSLLAELG
ncbi:MULTISPECIES: S49 family peptidase [unclassified Pseudomonas]|uniref:S49 family peptidase n=1 Tax=unclassified Pseudomonas TaxID=196821 RepID=UPI0015A108DB|nr:MULTISPECIES: S49 family peptidase [unclassified Pseudomonas]NWC92629.1 S49 family peptidase [Pseudomonas sp. IPO3779]NWD15626.1 S49 family peptidase [Pseudomonas sp. IPO3778]